MMYRWLLLSLSLLQLLQGQTGLTAKLGKSAKKKQLLGARGLIRTDFYGLSMEQLTELADQHAAELQRLQQESWEDDDHLGLMTTFRWWPWWPTKAVNVTCPELGNETFFYEEPFLHLSLPKCGDVIQPQMILQYEDKECHLDPAYLPNNITQDCVNNLLQNATMPMVRLVVLTHGFLKDLSSPWMHDLAASMRNQSNGTAALLVGWGRGSGGAPYPDPLYYYQAAANTRYMGAALAIMLMNIMDEIHLYSNSLVSPFIHCIGHSLGGHICGFSGKELKRRSAHFKISRISGLDPAGPLFAFDVPYPFNFLNISEHARLNREDALFVDVIHTDGRARFSWEVIPQYGTMMEIGHADFYPGADDQFGWSQPGCWRVGDIGSCSHSRSHDLYLASLSTPCPAVESCKQTEPVTEDCEPLADNPPLMGFPVGSAILPGSRAAFTVLTEALPPFCVPTPPTRKKL